MPTPNQAAITQHWLEQTNLLTGEMRTREWNQTSWRPFMDIAAFPAGMGNPILSVVFERQALNYSDTRFTDISNSDGEGESPCIQVPTIIPTGQTTFSAKLRKAKIASDYFCYWDMYTSWQGAELLDYQVNKMVNATSMVWTDFYKEGFYNTVADHYYLTTSGPIKTTLAKNIKTFDGLSTATPCNAKPNIQFMTYLYNELTRVDGGNSGAYATAANGCPIYTVSCSNELMNLVTLNNGDTAAIYTQGSTHSDLRYTKEANVLLQEQAKWLYRNFFYNVDIWPTRYNETNTAGTYTYAKVEPFVEQSAATKGVKSIKAAAYETASHELFYILSYKVFRVLVPDTFLGEYFNSANMYNGDYRWFMPQDQSNDEQNMGYFLNAMVAAVQPAFPDTGYVVMYKRPAMSLPAA